MKIPPDVETETRRTGGVRAGGRSARVVDAVLKAAAEELGRVGYAALRVEDVAARSGVNKTSIYRRWPTKVALVMAALEHAAPRPAAPDTGSLREDLAESARDMCIWAQTPLKRGLYRMLQAEREDPDLDAVIRRRRAEHLAARAALIERGIARGELPAGTDAILFAELVMSPMITRVHANEPADDAFIYTVIDLMIAGARNGSLALSRGTAGPASSPGGGP
jgi:AcrR family transcriptional regulator